MPYPAKLIYKKVDIFAVTNLRRIREYFKSGKFSNEIYLLENYNKKKI